MGELALALKQYFAFYSDERPHQGHEGRTPAEVYDGSTWRCRRDGGEIGTIITFPGETAGLSD
ncbi:MAG: hypothetical protein KZQ76_11150 [Candidatus Thiodiazotropha sp. (ex Epidulcina cf. delphinae)]|nr:hypothetical protein [Candidatus Thiodiazotropha sp. (ex Epidulcina cf. delphinae)]